ncbi:MAG: lytic transglycosylase domain-containing protein [Candidatus Thiodiazotropha sp.]
MANFQSWVIFVSLLLLVVTHSQNALADLDACFAKAARRYNVAGELLYAIAAQESRLDPAAIGWNGDGSRDIGVMQINSWWLPKLAEYGIDERYLQEPCTNVSVGAWILAGNIARFGYTWDAVGAYNAGTGDTEMIRMRREAYAHKVATQLGLYRRALGMHDATAQSR